MRNRLSFSIVWAAALVGANAMAAQAERATDYPNRPIRLVVPFAPGGGSDYVGRLVGQKLTAQLGQTVVVDNRPGAASLVGTEIVARAAPDGYTLCLCDVGFTINPAYYRKTSYDPVKSFDPVMVVAETPYILVVNPGLPYVSSLRDFIAQAKAQPGKINLGSAGSGSGTHFSGELFKQRAGIKLVHVPYKSAGASSADVASGQIQASMSTPPAALPLVRAGRLKILASCGAKRSALMPDVPTVAESGVSGVVMTNWYSIMSVAGTPKPVLKRLYEELRRAVSAPDMRERLASAALEPAPNTPEQFRKLIADELQRWKNVMRDAGIKPE
ncbi:MAG TPA: tripartite tricarboxylate transporter substrate binding protein [Burkholderiales bacterium]|nr:tripartite tricarboxylate transporter substrate binding protein [Burkholderiales bacterium]